MSVLVVVLPISFEIVVSFTLPIFFMYKRGYRLFVILLILLEVDQYSPQRVCLRTFYCILTKDKALSLYMLHNSGFHH